MKILIFTDSQGDFGSIYFDLGKYFHQRGHILNLLDWVYAYTDETFQLASEYYDYVVTSVSPNELHGLLDRGVPKEKIVGICHSSSELILLAQSGETKLLEEIAGYAVVCEDIYKTSIDLGIKREPAILAVGVTFERYKADPAEKLESVGYYGSLSAVNPHGVEILRGQLIKDVTESVGIQFKNIHSLPFQCRPSSHKTFGAFIVSSTREGSSLYSLEAAAAGRLVVSTGAGKTGSKILGINAIDVPIEKKKLAKSLEEILNFYVSNPEAYREKCLSIQAASIQHDWSRLSGDWVDFFQNIK